MLRQGKTTADLLEFVNQLLSLVSTTARGREPMGPLVDEQTGMPTRLGFVELVLYEHTLDRGSTRDAALLLLRIARGADPIIAGGAPSRLWMTLLRQIRELGGPAPSSALTTRNRPGVP